VTRAAHIAAQMYTNLCLWLYAIFLDISRIFQIFIMCINWFIRARCSFRSTFASLYYILHRYIFIYIYICCISLWIVRVCWLGQTPAHHHNRRHTHTRTHTATNSGSEFSAAKATAAPMTAFQKLNSYIFQRHGDGWKIWKFSRSLYEFLSRGISLIISSSYFGEHKMKWNENFVDRQRHIFSIFFDMWARSVGVWGDMGRIHGGSNWPYGRCSSMELLIAGYWLCGPCAPRIQPPRYPLIIRGLLSGASHSMDHNYASFSGGVGVAANFRGSGWFGGWVVGASYPVIETTRLESPNPLVLLFDGQFCPNAFVLSESLSIFTLSTKWLLPRFTRVCSTFRWSGAIDRSIVWSVRICMLGTPLSIELLLD